MIKEFTGDIEYGDWNTGTECSAERTEQTEKEHRQQLLRSGGDLETEKHTDTGQKAVDAGQKIILCPYGWDDIYEDS